MKTSIKNSVTVLIILFLLLFSQTTVMSWGFYAHRMINRMAVFTLPPDMVGFFKKHIEYLTENSVAPDKRAHVVEGEAPRHYIDVEYFEDDISKIPRFWNQAVEKYSEDTLYTHGLLPYHIFNMYLRLRNAFQAQSIDRILYNAAHIGHYIGDACTPLHTTKYYDGRTPEERGIHAFMETRLPILYAESYDFFVGRAEYIENPQLYAWQLVEESNAAVDTIYMVFDEMKKRFSEDQIYTYEMSGQTLARQFSEEYSRLFHEKLNGMVERQMRKSVFATGSFWFTAWVDAGQPDLRKLAGIDISEQQIMEDKKIESSWRNRRPLGRPNPDESIQ